MIEKLLCERNTYNSIPIFRDFADVFVHALKMCMWFGHYLESFNVAGVLSYYNFQRVNINDADQIRRLVCAFVVRMQQNQVFSRRAPYFEYMFGL